VSAASTPATRAPCGTKGILPCDTLDLLAQQRGGYVEVDRSSTLDWDALRKKIAARDGMRNSNCVAIAPTATISNIIGVDASIEPCFGNLSVKSNLSGEFTVINHYLVRDLKRLGLWDDVMVMDLKHFDGSLRPIDRVPQEIKALYATAFEVETQSGWWKLPRAARSGSTRPSRSTSTWRAPRARSSTTPTSWPGCAALKTTYYLRTISATHAEKSTVQSGRLNAVSSGSAPSGGMSALEAAAAAAQAQLSATPATDIKFCGVDDPTCEACQ
jgi:ribonucleoside-diphosphate reductase alpha chain